MIGVFDSGYGGLTILQALRQRMPQFDYIYLGDNARAPYGSRTQEEIYRFVRGGVDWLFKHGARIVILGCNTASANALKDLQKEYIPAHYPDRRILGILVPTVEAVTGAAWSALPIQNGAKKHVLIFATPSTVASLAYSREITKRNPAIIVTEQACPSLVALIEQGANPDVMHDAVTGCVAAARARMPVWPPDAVVLGCTHYALVSPLFREMCSGALVYAQGELTADALVRYFARYPEMTTGYSTNGTCEVFTTGDAGAVSVLATRFFHAPFTFAHAQFPTTL